MKDGYPEEVPLKTEASTIRSGKPIKTQLEVIQLPDLQHEQDIALSIKKEPLELKTLNAGGTCLSDDSILKNKHTNGVSDVGPKLDITACVSSHNKLGNPAQGRMKMRWNYQTENTLIKLIRERRILWDSSNELYSRKSLKKQEYDEIAHRLLQEFPDIPPHAMTGDAVRVKFNHLREYFRRLLKRVQVKEYGSDAGEESVPEWEHFTSLLFLNDTVTPNHYGSNLPAFKSYSETSEESKHTGTELKEARGIGLYLTREEEDSSYLSKILTPVTQLSTENCELLEAPAESGRPSPIPTTATVPEQGRSYYLNDVPFKSGLGSSPTPSCTKSYIAKKKRKRISPRNSEEALNISLACLNKITEKKEDQYDHFGKFVAAAIRSLPEGTRWPVMTNIWRALDKTINKE